MDYIQNDEELLLLMLAAKTFPILQMLTREQI